MVTEEGVELTETSAIRREAADFFRSLLTAPNETAPYTIDLENLIEYRCPPTKADYLVAQVTETEIKKVLFSMPSNKSSGLDGFTLEFFQAAWSIVGKEMVITVQSFFHYGLMPRGFNATILTLIPKKTNSATMKDFRPISCCNLIYKVISKIIANRLQEIIPDAVEPNQSAFVKERLLLENVLLATELVKNYHKDSITARCALKIDLSILSNGTSLSAPFTLWPSLTCLSIGSSLAFQPQHSQSQLKERSKVFSQAHVG